MVLASQGMLVFEYTRPWGEKLTLYPHVINWKNGIPVPEKAKGDPIDISTTWQETLNTECKAFLSALETGTTHHIWRRGSPSA